MSLTASQAALLVLAWAAYGLVHSALASLTVKAAVARRWPRFVPGYRVAFNVLAALLLLPPVWLTFAFRGPLLWEWTGALVWIANGLAVAALAGFVATTRHYDLGSFSGLAQWRTRSSRPDGDEAGFGLSPLHRRVRHPWYFLGLVILWTRDMDAARLVSSLCVTAYLWVGSLLEERKLLALLGEPYARYRRKVPGLFPLPGRFLSRAEAQALVAEGKSAGDATSMRKEGGGV